MKARAFRREPYTKVRAINLPLSRAIDTELIVEYIAAFKRKCVLVAQYEIRQLGGVSIRSMAERKQRNIQSSRTRFTARRAARS